MVTSALGPKSCPATTSAAEKLRIPAPNAATWRSSRLAALAARQPMPTAPSASSVAAGTSHLPRVDRSWRQARRSPAARSTAMQGLEMRLSSRDQLAIPE
ncbi:MAG: hypothetical protein IT338_17880 [Thermomicrobiales bacterium]|nr:hypothetical protein [Thermomicrobiales bacterium]